LCIDIFDLCKEVNKVKFEEAFPNHLSYHFCYWRWWERKRKKK